MAGRQPLADPGNLANDIDESWDDWDPRESDTIDADVADEDDVADPGQPNEGSPLGMNLAAVRYYSTELPFVDGFKSASRWVTQTIPYKRWNTGARIDLDADGWVRSLAAGKAVATLMFGGIDGHYPAGDYICLYDGEGVIEWVLDGHLVEKTPGREVVRVTPTDDGVVCRIVSTNPANHLRNIRFVMPGFEATHATDPWRPGFLSRWEKFKVLRFMDWQRTNHSPLGKWSKRTLPTRFSFDVSSGMPLEYMIDLCNRTGSDPWFCIPHLADNDFVRQFASLVFNTLDNSRTVHIEYSNETWNGSFAQEAYVRQKGLDLRLDPGSAGNARELYHARRITEIATIFEQVFGGTDRLVRVLAVQKVNAEMTRKMLDYVLGSNPVSDKIDVVAVAPYVGMAVTPGNASSIVNKSVAEILAILYNRMPAFEHEIRAQLSAIGNLPIDLVAYEGGQALRGAGGAENNQQLTDKLIAVNRDPGMEPFYKFYLESWRAAGGKSMVAFNSTFKPAKSGSWGALEFYDSDEQAAGKYSAMIKFIDNNQIWW